MKILVIDIQAFKNILRQLKHLGLKCVKNPMRTSQRRFKGRIHRCAASLRRFYNQQNKSCLKKLVLTTCLDALWQKKNFLQLIWFPRNENKCVWICHLVLYWRTKIIYLFFKSLGGLRSMSEYKEIKESSVIPETSIKWDFNGVCPSPHQ